MKFRHIFTAGVLVLGACTTTYTSQTTIGAKPSVTQAQIDSVGNISCADDLRRSPAIATAEDGFKGHIVQVCFGNRAAGHVVFWSQTNAEANRLTSVITDVTGTRYQRRVVPYNPDTGNNDFFITLQSALGPRECMLRKPSGGIAPLSIAKCS